MSFTRSNPPGWALFELLTSAQMNQVDINGAAAVDGTGGGTYTAAALGGIRPGFFEFDLSNLTTSDFAPLDGALLEAFYVVDAPDDIGSGVAFSVRAHASTGTSILIAADGQKAQSVGGDVLGIVGNGANDGGGVAGLGGAGTIAVGDGNADVAKSPGIHGDGNTSISLTYASAVGGYFTSADGQVWDTPRNHAAPGLVSVGGDIVGANASAAGPGLHGQGGDYAGSVDNNASRGGIGVQGLGGVTPQAEGVAGRGGSFEGGDLTIFSGSGIAGIGVRGAGGDTTGSGGANNTAGAGGVFLGGVGAGNGSGGNGVTGTAGVGAGTGVPGIGGRFTGKGNSAFVAGSVDPQGVGIWADGANGANSTALVAFGKGTTSTSGSQGTGVLGVAEEGPGLKGLISTNGERAPLNVDAGADPSLTVDGDFWYDANQLKFSNSSAQLTVMNEISPQVVKMHGTVQGDSGTGYNTISAYNCSFAADATPLRVAVTFINDMSNANYTVTLTAVENTIPVCFLRVRDRTSSGFVIQANEPDTPHTAIDLRIADYEVSFMAIGTLA